MSEKCRRFGGFAPLTAASGDGRSRSSQNLDRAVFRELPVEVVRAGGLQARRFLPRGACEKQAPLFIQEERSPGEMESARAD